LSLVIDQPQGSRQRHQLCASAQDLFGRGTAQGQETVIAKFLAHGRQALFNAMQAVIHPIGQRQRQQIGFAPLAGEGIFTQVPERDGRDRGHGEPQGERDQPKPGWGGTILENAEHMLW